MAEKSQAPFPTISDKTEGGLSTPSLDRIKTCHVRPFVTDVLAEKAEHHPKITS
ncbi:MAG: hypothetical protein NPIRA01_01330 [Nitrospirales bacterium]|nr:MAG: hypothetical protein NPIRA01_01330 [Nitrospirales bacterium]